MRPIRTYSALLRANGAELKVMQELMRHSTIRVTLDTYTQAVTTEKRAAQTAVVSLFVTNKIRRRERRPEKPEASSVTEPAMGIARVVDPVSGF
jgi:integrase